MDTGQHRHRIVVLSRVLAPKDDTGEQAESWPEPPTGTNRYYAARERLAAAELIVQGLRQTTGGMRLRIRGGRLPIYATDRVRFLDGGNAGGLWSVTGVSRDEADTVVDVEEVSPQPNTPPYAPGLSLAAGSGNTSLAATVTYPPLATSVFLRAYTTAGVEAGNATVSGNAGAGNTAAGNLAGLAPGTTYRVTAVGVAAAGNGPISGPVERATGA